MGRYRKSLPAHLQEFLQRERQCNDDVLKSTTQVQRCLSASPLPCEMLNETIELEIVDEIVTGYAQKAQVVRCSSPSLQTKKPIVAKIFDPLYMPFESREFRGVPRDPLRAADDRFSTEASAYEELNSHFGGGLIPEYFGSWRLEFPLLDKFRTVFLVLMEFIPGISLRQFDPERCTRDERLNLLSKVMEANIAMHYVGVSHNDLAPRNIFCDRDEIGDPDLKIRIVDFDIARLSRYLGYEALSSKQPLPPSPIQYYHRNYIITMPEWADYRSDHRANLEWMRSIWGGSTAYMPVEEDLLQDFD